MNRVFVTVALVAAFFIGFIGGWRSTMTQAEISFIDHDMAAITVWGVTDVYFLEAVG